MLRKCLRKPARCANLCVMHKNEQRDLIPTAEVARILGVRVSTVSRRVARGDLDYAMKLPGETGAYLFDRAAIERLAVERKSA